MTCNTDGCTRTECTTRRLTHSEWTGEYCPDHDPLDDDRVEWAFEEAEAV